MANALLAILSNEDVESFPPGDEQVVLEPGPNFAKSDNFWPVDNSLPSLAQFDGKESWLLFH